MPYDGWDDVESLERSEFDDDEHIREGVPPTRREQLWGRISATVGCCIILLVAAGVIFMCSGIMFPTITVEERVYRDVERVMMHTPYRYTFIIDGKLTTVRVPSGDAVAIHYDVHEDEMIWAEGTVRSSHMGVEFKTLNIHLHNIEELNGGGWHRGKHGSGTTTVLE